MSFSYNNLGNIEEAQGNPTSAKEYYLKCLAILKRLAEETDALQDRHNFSISYIKLGNIEKAQGNPTSAKEYYLKSLAIFKKLAEETNTTQVQNDLAATCVLLALLESGWRKEKYLVEAESIWTKLCRQCPDNPEFVQKLDIVRSTLRTLLNES